MGKVRQLQFFSFLLISGITIFGSRGAYPSWKVKLSEEVSELSCSRAVRDFAGALLNTTVENPEAGTATVYSFGEIVDSLAAIGVVRRVAELYAQTLQSMQRDNLSDIARRSLADLESAQSTDDLQICLLPGECTMRGVPIQFHPGTRSFAFATTSDDPLSLLAPSERPQVGGMVLGSMPAPGKMLTHQTVRALSTALGKWAAWRNMERWIKANLSAKKRDPLFQAFVSPDGTAVNLGFGQIYLTGLGKIFGAEIARAVTTSFFFEASTMNQVASAEAWDELQAMGEAPQKVLKRFGAGKEDVLLLARTFDRLMERTLAEHEGRPAPESLPFAGWLPSAIEIDYSPRDFEISAIESILKKRGIDPEGLNLKISGDFVELDNLGVSTESRVEAAPLIQRYRAKFLITGSVELLTHALILHPVSGDPIIAISSTMPEQTLSRGLESLKAWGVFYRQALLSGSSPVKAAHQAKLFLLFPNVMHDVYRNGLARWIKFDSAYFQQMQQKIVSGNFTMEDIVLHASWLATHVLSASWWSSELSKEYYDQHTKLSNDEFIGRLKLEEITEKLVGHLSDAKNFDRMVQIQLRDLRTFYLMRLEEGIVLATLENNGHEAHRQQELFRSLMKTDLNQVLRHYELP